MMAQLPKEKNYWIFHWRNKFPPGKSSCIMKVLLTFVNIASTVVYNI